jgi:kumamolisin
VRVDGQSLVIGGTSAVAPLWAGLIALNNQTNGRSAGFIQPQIYAAGAASAFHDIVSGNNGAFSAGPGWDACTGLGSPIGSKLITLLAASTATKKKKAAPKKATAKKAAAKKPLRKRPARKKKTARR